MANVALMKKISVGGINNVRKGFKGIVERTIMGRIVGIARMAKWEEGDLGQYAKFIGDFLAWNKDGEQFAAPVCFLPEPAQSMLASAVQGDESGNGVQFAFDFVAAPDENSVTGYQWQAVPLLEVRVSDPMQEVLKAINAPALSSPPENNKLEEIPAEVEPKKATGGESEKAGKGRKREQEPGA